MKWMLTISFLFLCGYAFSQQDPALLSKNITATSATELEKVTAIFKWITENVSYKINSKGSSVKTGKSSIKKKEDDKEDDGPLKPLTERVAEIVLSKREAVCDGYARLFTTLCNYAGIRSEIIVGYAKSGTNKPMQRFGVNHYWNSVLINGKWHLLDVTWASGYITANGNEFVREYDKTYFLTTPEMFIQDHYPDDVRWTLLPGSKVPQEFLRSPFRQKSFSKYQITSYFPDQGVIETFVGDTIHLQIETAHTESGRDVSPDLLVDSTIFSESASWIFLRPDISKMPASQHHHHYLYPVISPDVEWLYLLYNDDMVLRYKVNVRKGKQ